MPPLVHHAHLLRDRYPQYNPQPALYPHHAPQQSAYFQGLLSSLMRRAVYRCLSDADRSMAHLRYMPHQPVRNRSVLPDGYSVPLHRKVFRLRGTVTDNPVRLHLKIRHAHGSPLRSDLRSDAADGSAPYHLENFQDSLRTWM